MLLRFKPINKEWEDRLQHQRRKLIYHDMEERAEWSGMIIYLRDEALRTTALNKDELNAALNLPEGSPERAATFERIALKLGIRRITQAPDTRRAAAPRPPSPASSPC